MTTPEAEIEIPQLAECGPPDPPPIPQLPAAGPKRELTLRQYATRIVDKLVVRCREKIPSGQEPSAATMRLPEAARGYQLSASHH